MELADRVTNQVSTFESKTLTATPWQLGAGKGSRRLYLGVARSVPGVSAEPGIGGSRSNAAGESWSRLREGRLEFRIAVLGKATHF